MSIDLGLWHVRTMESSSKRFVTVEDSLGDVYIYEHPYGASAKELRDAIIVAFIDEPRYEPDPGEEYKVMGRYPDYRIEEVPA